MDKYKKILKHIDRILVLYDILIDEIEDYSECIYIIQKVKYLTLRRQIETKIGTRNFKKGGISSY
jgi:hypothetical protein